MLIDWQCLQRLGAQPTLKNIWGFALILPFLMGTAATVGAGGAPLSRRIAAGAICGVGVGAISAVLSGLLIAGEAVEISIMAITGVWRAFVFTIIAVLGVLLTEVNMPETRGE